jgi:hypothetical protein
MTDSLLPKYAAASFCSLAVFVLTLIVKDILFLTTNSLVYLYEGIDALGLYSCSCLLYASLRLLELKRTLRVHFLFAKTFSLAFLYGIMVLLGIDFNVLGITASVLCLMLCVSSISCILIAFVGGNKVQAEEPAERAASATGAERTGTGLRSCRGSGWPGCTARRRS